MKQALTRNTFARNLVTRQLDRQVIIRRRRTLQDGPSVQEPYVNHSVIMVSIDMREAWVSGRSDSEGTQRGARHSVELLADADSDIRVTDRIVVGASAIVSSPVISYTGGEEIEVTGVSGLEDDPALKSVNAIRHTSRRA